VVVVQSGTRTRIASILTPEGETDQAFAPQAVNVTLTDEVDASRGDMLAHVGNVPRLESTFDALVVWLAETELVPGRQYWIKHTTSTVSGRVTDVRYRLNVNTLHREPADRLGLNEVGRCRLTVNRPLALDAYRRNRTTGAFVLIDRLTNVTVGAGMVVDRATSSETLDDHWRDGESLPAVPVAHVGLRERQERYGQQPATILLTGLSGSGKTTLAYALERSLFDEGYVVCVLDGRGVRSTISRDLGYSAAERSENLRRSMEVARLLNDAGVLCICAFLAPSKAVREKAKNAVGPDRFVEVHLSAPPDVCQARDPNATGASVRAADFELAYEVPPRPDLTLDTHRLSVEECTQLLMAHLRSRGLLVKGGQG
jgi:bifunctional enzyme CysN/CysC